MTAFGTAFAACLISALLLLPQSSFIDAAPSKPDILTFIDKILNDPDNKVGGLKADIKNAASDQACSRTPALSTKLLSVEAGKEHTMKIDSVTATMDLMKTYDKAAATADEIKMAEEKFIEEMIATDVIKRTVNMLRGKNEYRDPCDFDTKMKELWTKKDPATKMNGFMILFMPDKAGLTLSATIGMPWIRYYMRQDLTGDGKVENWGSATGKEMGATGKVKIEKIHIKVKGSQTNGAKKCHTPMIIGVKPEVLVSMVTLAHLYSAGVQFDVATTTASGNPKLKIKSSGTGTKITKVELTIP